ncbi:MAG: glutathione S-transferase N-terminal domain-containing protein [Methylohalobius sp. ZOD2]
MAGRRRTATRCHILLEETGLDYRVHPVDIGAGEQFDPEFLAISPNNKIPAIVDTDGLRIISARDMHRKERAFYEKAQKNAP